MGRLCRLGSSVSVMGPGACCEIVGSSETSPGISTGPVDIAGPEMSSGVVGPVDATGLGKVAEVSKTVGSEEVAVVGLSVVDGVWASVFGSSPSSADGLPLLSLIHI